jgi:peptidoglycan/xylan/chitin deacetylase (PgdA/CDA1 family)
MRSLAEAGYSAITTRELARYLSTADDSALPERPVLITFDDGRTDAMLQADPILRDTGMKATMFAIGSVSKDASFYYVDWPSLVEYTASGRWELGNHTYGLHRLHDDVKGRKPVSALVDVSKRETLAGYKRRIGADLDRMQALLAGSGRSLAFAYPFGDWGQHARRADVPKALNEVLRRRFQLAFDQDEQSGWRFAMPGDDQMHIHRLQVEDWTGPELIARLTAAAKHSRTTYEERALNVSFESTELAAAAVSRATCPPARAAYAGSDTGARKLLALTFDDGPSPYTAQILDVLEDADARATFFVVGNEIAGRERLLQRMAMAGMEIGNHSWNFDSRPEHDAATLMDSFSRTNRAIVAAAAYRPCSARIPWGLDRDVAAGVVHGRLGLSDVRWSADPRDDLLRKPQEIARRILAAARPGAVIALHDGGGERWATVQALPEVLAELERRGFRLVTASELIRTETLEAKPKAAEPIRRVAKKPRKR